MLQEKTKKKEREKHDRQRTAKNQTIITATAVCTPRPYSVEATNSLMSAWRTRLVECAAIIAIFAFAR